MSISFGMLLWDRTYKFICVFELPFLFTKELFEKKKERKKENGNQQMELYYSNLVNSFQNGNKFFIIIHDDD